MYINIINIIIIYIYIYSAESLFNALYIEIKHRC